MNIKDKNSQKLHTLCEIKNTSMIINDMLWGLFYNPDVLEGNKTNDEAKIRLKEFWETSRFGRQKEKWIERATMNNIEVLSKDIIKNNEYVKTVKFDSQKQGEYELTMDSYEPYEAFARDDITVDSDYLEISRIGYFKEKVTFPSLNYRNVTWMSINPNEINTMQPYIDEATGDVLVLGLGLGYYAFMVSQKDNVKSVTIIENDQNIIDLFTNNLFIQFPHLEKIKIVKADAFKYLKNNRNKYDYAFVDLWHSPEDGLAIYIKCRKMENHNYIKKYGYWLHKSLLAMYRRCVITIIEEAFDDFSDDNYLKSRNDIDEIINEIYWKSKFATIDDNNIDRFLSDEELDKLIIK